MSIAVREMMEDAIEPVVNYFINASPDYLLGMGADPAKLPSKEDWIKSIKKELIKPYQEKNLYYVIWLIDRKEVGHSSINKITFGKEAYMHLHMWNNEDRRKGMGLKLVQQSLPYYFTNFNLEQLICEPYALNPAPARTLSSAGFDFDKEFETIPGKINLYQKVKRFILTKEKWKQMMNETTKID